MIPGILQIARMITDLWLDGLWRVLGVQLNGDSA